MIARQVLSPLNLERMFGLTCGNIFQGEMTLNQLFLLRPVVGSASYRTPIRGLFLCGAAAHQRAKLTSIIYSSYLDSKPRTTTRCGVTTATITPMNILWIGNNRVMIGSTVSIRLRATRYHP